MCGRARLSSDVSEIKIAFRIPPERPAPNFAASWNVAPTDPLPVVRYDAKEHYKKGGARFAAKADPRCCEIDPDPGGIGMEFRDDQRRKHRRQRPGDRAAGLLQKH